MYSEGRRQPGPLPNLQGQQGHTGISSLWAFTHAVPPAQKHPSPLVYITKLHTVTAP